MAHKGRSKGRTFADILRLLLGDADDKAFGRQTGKKRPKKAFGS